MTSLNLIFNLYGNFSIGIVVYSSREKPKAMAILYTVLAYPWVFLASDSEGNILSSASYANHNLKHFQFVCWIYWVFVETWKWDIVYSRDRDFRSSEYITIYYSLFCMRVERENIQCGKIKQSCIGKIGKNSGCKRGIKRATSVNTN